MTTLYESLYAHGLRPRRPIIPDGKWHPCATISHPRKRNGRYKLATDGRVGWFMDWAIDHAPHTWRPDRTERAASFDPAALRKSWEKDRAHRAARTEAARRFYADCSPLIGGHPYLESHCLDMTGAIGLRVDNDGWLVVPAYRERQIQTVQRISPEGEKLFWKGASAKGATFAVGRRNSSLTVICEGLATGLAIFAAVPESRVVVAFNAGNLINAPAPRGLALVASDNDWETVCPKHRDEGLSLPFTPWEQRPEWCRCNPGRCAATEAAVHFGCGIALPDDIEGTDWCDWRQEIATARIEQRRPKERETDIRRAVDAQIAMHMRRAAKFVGAREEMAQ